jgi:HEAT repeat protein
MSFRTRVAAGLIAILIGAAPLTAQLNQQKAPAGQLKNDQPQPGQPKQSPGFSSQITELGGKKLQDWIKDISANDPSVRENAIRTVVMFGPAAVEAVPALIDRVNKDRDCSPRVCAIMALGAIDGMSADEVSKVVTALTNRLTDSQDIVRYQAALVLGRFGAYSRSAIPKLIPATKDLGSWEVRKAAIFALGRASTDPKTTPSSATLAALTYPLSSSYETSAQVRLEAVMALGMLGMPLDKKDQGIVEHALRAGMRDVDKTVCIWSRIVWMYDSRKVTDADLNALVKFTKSPEPVARIHSARALGILGKEAASKLPDLMSLLDDRDTTVQYNTIIALAQMGSIAKPAVGKLKQIKANPDMQESEKQFIQSAISAIDGQPMK